MSRRIEFEDFSLRLFSDREQGLSVRVERAPYGSSQEAATRLLLDAENLSGFLQSLESSVRGSGAEPLGLPMDARDVGRRSGALHYSQPDPLEVGRRLYQSLFPPPIHEVFVKSLAWAEARAQRALRLRIMVDPTSPELISVGAMPWELIYKADSRDFLSRNLVAPVIRHLDVPQLRVRDPPKPPLRVLVVIANPRGTANLDLEEEKTKILSAWGGRDDLELEVLAEPTIVGIRRTLRGGMFHVLHFMGHGRFDLRSGEGELMLETESGDLDAVAGRVLAETLKGCGDLRLVFLNACETAKLARLESQDPYSGVASALVMGGIPAVVSMQFAISDLAAIEFSEAFYTALAEGDLIETAVVEGRLAIHQKDPDSWEWATPVLYMSCEEGRVLGDTTSGDGAGATKESVETVLEPTVEGSRGVVVGRKVRIGGLRMGKDRNQ